MATSTVKMQGAIINGVRVAPGTNHNSYELGFGWTAYQNRIDTAKNISTATNTEIISVELGSNYGRYIVFGRSVWPASNKTNGVRRTMIQYSCTNSDGTTSSGTVATQNLRPSQGNMTAHDMIATTLNFDNGCTNIVIKLLGYQDTGSTITVQGFIYAARM